ASVKMFKGTVALPVSGKVTGSDGETLPGVTVKIKGTTKGTITGADGSFKIDVPDGNAVLIVSSTGYETQEVNVGSRSVINITLANDIKALEEVVVVGYGERKKSDLTGSIVSVGSKELNQRPVVNAMQGMQGRAAGIDITSNERPGQVGKVTIRGVRSLTASNDPLYVVDGIPLISGGIDNLNPNDIESVDVLKDASATAIYGSRGANGVVIITTKKGKNGKYTLSFNSNFTSETLNNSAELMSASEYIDYRRWAFYYRSTPTQQYPRGDQPTEANDKIILNGTADLAAWANVSKGWATGTWDGSKVETTDWVGMVTQPSLTGQHTLSVSGGSEKLKAYASFGFLDNEGTVKGQGYKRYTGKLSVDIKATDWFTMGGVLNTSYAITEFGQSDAVGNNIAGGLYESARRMFSYAVPYDLNGVRIELPGNDPLVRTIVDEEKYSQDQRTNLRLFGSFYSEVNFGVFTDFLKGLKYRANFGPDVAFERRGIFLDKLSVTRNGSHYASLAKEQSTSYTLDNMLTYNRTINKGQLGVTLLHTQTEFDVENNRMAADNIAFSEQKWNALNSVPVLSAYSSGLTQRQLRSYMGRVNYDYDNRFLLTVSGRYDGASQLAEGNKWAFFPSAALAWRLNNEKFLQNQTWIDALKVRAGYGVTGNSAINPYATLGGLLPIFYPIGSSLTSGVTNNTTLANQDLTWEKTAQFNYGIDFSFFKRKVSGSLDFYTSQTSDLLMLRQIPSVTGFNNTYANVGETASRGVDLTLSTSTFKRGDFEWTTTFNGSWQANEILTLSKGKEDEINNRWFIGQSLGVIYDFESNGIWKEADGAEMAKFNANLLAANAFVAGNVRPKDLNGDYKLDANNDRKVLGSTIPKFIVGLTNSFDYKGFSVSVMLYGRLSYLYNTGGEALNGRGMQRVVSYYTPNNTNSDYQRPFRSDGAGDNYSPILGYKDGSFIKVRNVSLGYNIPEKFSKSIGLSNAKLIFQAQNLGMVYNNISWIDMDTQSSAWNRGYTFGINLDF
ncbi:MAG: TonB-dependent receptor, partial [Flectobacillus sp.]|nr:TonB-dependent receptor [Flectobacillus sp.]